MENSSQGWNIYPSPTPDPAPPPAKETIVYVPVEKEPRISAFNILGLILFGFIILSWLTPAIGAIFPVILIGLLVVAVIDIKRSRSSAAGPTSVPQGYKPVGQPARPSQSLVIKTLKVLAFVGIAIVLVPYIFFAVFVLILSSSGGHMS